MTIILYIIIFYYMIRSSSLWKASLYLRAFGFLLGTLGFCGILFDQTDMIFKEIKPGDDIIFVVEPAVLYL